MAETTPPSTDLPLQDRIAIVTGASRGIGRAISLHLASLGAKLILNYSSNSSAANLLASQINSSSSPNNPRAIAIQADVSDPNQVKSLFDSAEKAFNSPIHILINSAGVLDSKYPTISNTAIEDWDNTFNVNTRGTFLCCKEASNRILRGGGGRIIAITSSAIGGLYPGYAAYAASKAAVETMVKILAKELKGTGITANCIAPGPVGTEMFYAGKSEEMVKRLAEACPLGRIGETEDVAPLVGFIASDAGGWVNGQVLRANGGAVIT
ncbi:3-oxoacyl-[acyl-carrier-protein] reductase [Ranunculus cassubicifolius]